MMQGRVPKVVVIGGTYVDMAIRCGQIPSPGQSVAGSSLVHRVTGPGPNQAAEAALCGCQVHLISKVGGDCFAELAKQSLTECNVNTDLIFCAEAKNTGTVVTLVSAEGENASCSYSGANNALRPQDIDTAEQVIADSDVCLIHGRLPHDTIASAIRCAQLHGRKIILNPARPIESRGQQSEGLPIEYFAVDILIPNFFEAADIAEQSAPNIRTAKLIGSDLVARGVGAAVITMGKRGSLVVDRDGADHIPAFEVEVVDQTARGDAFAGALAACTAVGDAVRQSVTFASAAGALACTKFGAIEALPTKGDIIELLQKEDTDGPGTSGAN